jgi:hypothetical protein
LFIIGGVKDLKIYADLALLSVEGDEHVGRVTSLHSATIGYSPMIFRIEDINGEIEMMERWNEVWESLKKDEALPQKLVIVYYRYSHFWLGCTKCIRLIEW